MRVSELTNRPPQPVDVPITLNGQHAFNVTVDQNKITRYWAQHAEDETVYSFYETICEVLLAWDMVNDDDTPYPLNAEAMGELKLTFADDQALLTQIIRAAQPSSEEGNVSSAPSPTPPTTYEAPAQTHQNGLPISPSPAPSASPSPT